MNVDFLRLRLGQKCNLRCDYCIQNHVSNDYFVDDKLIFYLNSNYVLPINNKIWLYFIGGEPLLYYDLIQYFYSRLNKDKFNFGIITNGSLLDEVKINWFNKNKFYINISYDGNKHRGYDVVLDKGELIYKPDNLLFTSVFTNDSLLYDKIRVFKKIYNKYFQTHLYSFSLKFIVPFDYYFTEKSISEIDLESKKFFSYKNFYKEYTLEKQIIRDIYSNLIFLKKTSAKNIKYMFSKDSGDYHIGINGNIYNCWDSSPFGNIHDDEFVNIANDNYDRCKVCDVNQFCKFIYNHKQYWDSFCKFSKNYYRNFLN